MRTAIDTSVLLDVLGADPAFGSKSREALRQAYDAGALVACDVVWAETRAHFETDAAFVRAVTALGLEFDALDSDAAALAGALWRRQAASSRRRTGATNQQPKRLVADFLVGAHAALKADALLTRDRGFYRQYFKKLRVLTP